MQASAIVRPPAVAGRFYPGNAAALAQVIRDFLRDAPTPPRAAKGIIAPHAGYIYSGAIAATAYAHLAPRAAEIRRVLLLGPAHRVYVEGLALPGAGRLATPLGEIEVDAELARELAALPCVSRSPEAHALEHSLEVHLPFIQVLLPQAKVVPLVVGDARPAQVADVLRAGWGGPETAIVISSDMSHFHPYAEAARIDAATAARIIADTGPGIDPRQACGARGIDGLLELQRERPLELELLELKNSGDTAGDKARVVGYASFAIHEGRR